MKLLLALTATISAGKNSERKRNNALAQELFKENIVEDAIRELKTTMNLEGMEMADYMSDVYTAYLADNLEQKEKFDQIAREEYDIGSLSRSGGEQGVNPRNGMDSLSMADKMHMMKYLQLKYTILFLQQNKFIGKYCFYGCWCLPAGTGKEMMGYGVPVDNIDKSCREYTTCYNCLYNQEIMGERCDEMAAIQERYQITGNQNPQTGKVTLFCQDPQGSCARSRCECDKALSEKLSENEEIWNLQHHHKWGTPPFNRAQSCQASSASAASSAIYSAAVASAAVASAAMTNPVTTLEAQSFDGNKDGKSESNYKESNSIANLANILSQINTAHQENSEGGDLNITVQKGGGGGKTKITQVVQSSPIYGAISGCCGRAPDVHYYRTGQRCCLDGEIVDMNAPCSMDFM